MNRRYLIGGAAVVAVVGLWYVYGQSGSGGSASGATAASAALTPTSTPAQTASAIPTSQLYGATTANNPSPSFGTLSSLSAFGKPRDAFVQIVGGASSSTSSNSPTFGSSTTTSPISLGSGPTTAVPSATTPTSTGGVTTTPTPTTLTPIPIVPVQNLAAEFDINGAPLVALVGDAIPPETQQFTVKSMTTAQVVLALNGALLANGANSITIKVGQSLTVENQTAATTTVIHLLSVHSA